MLHTAWAQTCCTGGVPITGAIRLNQPEKNSFGLALNYDNNKIEDFFQEDEKLDADYIQRRTTTVSIQADYGLTEKLSLLLLIPYAWMSEGVTQGSTTEQVQKSSLGDISLMGNYIIFNKDRFNTSVGGGIKFPTGKTDQRDQFILPPTLQVGTGSIDFIFFADARTSFDFRKSLTLQQTFSYKLNTTGEQFASHENYRFGNEFQSFTSLTDQILIGTMLHSPSLLLRIRVADNNEIEDLTDINSGGLWMYLVPGWSLELSKRVSAGVFMELPVYRDLNGFQLTTTSRFIASVYFNLSSKNKIQEF
jgi:hypothetical protein